MSPELVERLMTVHLKTPIIYHKDIKDAKNYISDTSSNNALVYLSFPRKWESRTKPSFWIPAYAGMTFFMTLGEP